MIQWYPGHMAKAKRILKDDLKLVDLIIEVLDARAPYSTQNPDLQSLVKAKKRVAVLNKKDLADPELNQKWLNYFKGDAVLLNSMTGEGVGDLKNLLNSLHYEITNKL
ncbi:MAG: ribosome biogenesis GTPase YlqF, partial [Halanaerobium sp. MSAO_Bac5]